MRDAHPLPDNPDQHNPRSHRHHYQGCHDGLGLRPGKLADAHPQQGEAEELANRFREPGDPFKIVIVRDMWLTGFDAPSLHTMYVDKPMRGHGLMQAIARALATYTEISSQLRAVESV